MRLLASPEFLKGDADSSCPASTFTAPTIAILDYTIGSGTVNTPINTDPSIGSLITAVPDAVPVPDCTGTFYEPITATVAGITQNADTKSIDINVTDRTLAATGVVVTITPQYNTVGTATGTNWTTTFTTTVNLLDPCETPDSLTTTAGSTDVYQDTGP